MSSSNYNVSNSNSSLSNSSITDSSSTSEEERMLDVTIDKWCIAHQAAEKALKEHISGVQAESSRRRRPRTEIKRIRQQGHDRLFNDYFSSSPTYTDYQFRRRFRMQRTLFLRIMNRLTEEVSYFPQRRDAAGRLGLTPLQKCTAAMRMLAYGVAADSVNDYVRIGASAARQCLREFVQGIIDVFGDEYLRRPNTTDLQRLLASGERRGFPGMLGSIDCMHWEWKNCPIHLKGQYTGGHQGRPTIVLEAVASEDQWIWHSFFGTPGTCNDINVLDRSPVFDDLLEGRAPEVSFVVNGNQYNMGYYLTDSIYLEWSTFIQSIRLPQGPKACRFAEEQEAARKDVERAFGVLQARFAIVRGPAQQWDAVIIGKIMRACIILHNMIVEDERATYSVSQYSDVSHFDVVDTTQVNPPSNLGHRPREMTVYLSARISLRDKETHRKLKKDLVENIWQKFGHV